MDDDAVKPLEFVGSARKDLKALPDTVRQVFGRALLRAQLGGKPDRAKPLKGFRGAGVLEIVEDYDTDTYRAVYTALFIPCALWKSFTSCTFFRRKARQELQPPHAICS